MSGKPDGKKKRFNEVKSPFHLLFYSDGKFTMREFDQLPELAKFVKQLSLGWDEYGIIHGEVVKSLPQNDDDGEIPEDYDRQPESGIEDLDEETARELLGSHDEL